MLKIRASRSSYGQLSCLITLFIGLSPIFVDKVKATDLGCHGAVFTITERDPVEMIKEKLGHMKALGTLAAKQKEIEEKAAAQVKRPRPVEGLRATVERRTFYYDPSITVKKDLMDHKGRKFYKKGTKVNPLETLKWRHPYLFINGDEARQVELMKDWKGLNTKIILVAGSPLDISQQISIPVFFDQFGTLVKKLNIKQVPALVTQEGLKLKIEEFIAH